MIVVGIGLVIVGGFIVLVSAAGFDEARKKTREFALPTVLLAIGLAVIIWGVWLAKTS